MEQMKIVELKWRNGENQKNNKTKMTTMNDEEERTTKTNGKIVHIIF